MSESNAKREWIDGTFKTIGDVLLGSLQAIHTREGRIRSGIACASRLKRPAETPYGTFTVKYDYEDGCVPLREFGCGIGAIETRVRTTKGNRLIYLVGKKSSDAQNYHTGVYRVDDELEPATRIGACELASEHLPQRIGIGEPVEMGGPLALLLQEQVLQQHGIETAGAIVTQVRGLTNGSRSHT